MSAPLPQRSFGTTGLVVSALGFGGGRIGEADVSDDDARALLLTAVDCGITLFDTARSYGASEERMGRHLAAVRDRVVLSTKLGYGVDGVPDWTAACIDQGIDGARTRLRTDVIDIVHLHSCPREVLERGEVVEALSRAVDDGRVRVAAYSGDNEALAWAVHEPRFASVQTSVNLCDRWSAQHVLPEATRLGLGVIAKRPLANACWHHPQRPQRDDVAHYWDRWQTLAIDPAELAIDELALRFAAFAPGVHACIVGTADAEHLRRDVELVGRGPLEAATLAALDAAWSRHGGDWPGQI